MRMDPEHYRERLRERLQQLDADEVAHRHSRAPVELDQARVGRLSRMDALQQQAMSQAANRMMQIERQRIRAALERMERGDYGICALCGDDIAESRLRFDPSVPVCIECAREQGE